MAKRDIEGFKEKEKDEIAKGADKIMSIPKKKSRLRIARVEGQVLSYEVDEDIITLYSVEGEHVSLNKYNIDDVIEELKELKGVIE